MKYHKNPTVFVEFYILETKLKRLAHNYPRFSEFTDAVVNFPGTFTPDEFAELLTDHLMVPAGKGPYRERSVFQEEMSKLSLLHHTMEDVKQIEECQDLIASILHYFMRQHPINQAALFSSIEALKEFLAGFLSTFYSSTPPANLSPIVYDFINHLERAYTITKYADPYIKSFVTFNEFVSTFPPSTPTNQFLLSSLGVMAASALRDEKDGAQVLINKYIEKCNDICQELNPFQNTSVYQLKDLTKLDHIFQAKGTTLYF